MSKSSNFSKKKTVLASAIAIVGCASLFLFKPHTIRVEPNLTDSTRAASLQFKKKPYTIRASLYDALRGNVTLHDQGNKQFVFTGYIPQNDGIVLNQGNVKHIYRNTTVVADYKPQTYYIDLSDGTKIIQTISRPYGQNIVLPKNGLTAEKHPYENFTGWKNSKGQITQNVSVSDVSDETFVPTWAGKSYKIAYNLDGGTAQNPGSYQYGKGLSALAPAAKAGYIFDGWFSDAGHTHQISTIGKDSHENLTLYAAFHPIPAPPVVRQRRTYYPQYVGYRRYNQQGGYGDQAAPAYNGGGYNWTAIHGEQAEVDAGNLIQYDDYGNYYAAHDSTAYGRAIAGMRAGDSVTVNGRKAVIDGQFVVNRGNTYMDDVINRIPGGINSPAFQTCIDHNGNVVIKYGHYAN